jgi:hypothetical protein
MREHKQFFNHVDIDEDLQHLAHASVAEDAPNGMAGSHYSCLIVAVWFGFTLQFRPDSSVQRSLPTQ